MKDLQKQLKRAQHQGRVAKEELDQIQERHTHEKQIDTSMRFQQAGNAMVREHIL